MARKVILEIGDNVDYLDHHTTVCAPYIVPCYVMAIEGDYYVLRPRTFHGTPIRVGMYSKNLRKDDAN